MKKLLLSLIVASLFFLFSVNCGEASFGVSPAEINYEYAAPGMIIEKEFLLSRTGVDKDAEIVIEKAVNGLNDGIEFDPGAFFVIPKGKSTATLNVKISIPEDVAYKNYKGDLIIKIAEGGSTAGVSIIEGIDVTVNLSMTKLKVSKLLIRKLEISGVAVGDPINLILAAENQGNVKAAPDKVVIVFKNSSGKELGRCEELSLDEIAPGKTEDILVECNNNLNYGEYRAGVVVYFQNEIIKDETLVFLVKEKVIKTNEKFRVVANWIDDRNYFFKLVIFFIIPSTFIWAVLKKKYLN